jgi:hypothetical protein
MPRSFMPGMIPGCNYCRHSNDDGTCAAYPAGIPYAINTGDVPHTVPLPGDHGIQFEPQPIPGLTAQEYAATLATVDE